MISRHRTSDRWKGEFLIIYYLLKLAFLFIKLSIPNFGQVTGIISGKNA